MVPAAFGYFWAFKSTASQSALDLGYGESDPQSLPQIAAIDSGLKAGTTMTKQRHRHQEKQKGVPFAFGARFFCRTARVRQLAYARQQPQLLYVAQSGGAGG